MGNELRIFLMSCILAYTCLSRHQKTWLNKRRWLKKVQGLQRQLNKIYPRKEFLDQENVKDNLQLQNKWHKIAHYVKWQGLVKYLQKPQKSLQWPIEAGFAMAGSQMKYINHNIRWYIHISFLNKFFAQVNEDFCSR